MSIVSIINGIFFTAKEILLPAFILFILIEFILSWIEAFIIVYKDCWISNEKLGRYRRYFMGSGYKHVWLIFKKLWDAVSFYTPVTKKLKKSDKDVFKEESQNLKLLILRKLSIRFGACEFESITGTVLAFFYIPLWVFGIIESIFGFILVLLLSLAGLLLHGGIVTVGFIINFLLIVLWGIVRIIRRDN